MSVIPDFTIVIALDTAHLDQFRVVWPTWRKNAPELLDREMLIICDGNQAAILDWQRRLEWLDHSRRFLVPWAWPYERWGDLEEVPGGISQRERMLTAFVKVPPRLVDTPYWLKLDTDAVCHEPGRWLQEEHFEGGPAIIASPWGYTKKAEWLEDLDRWAEDVPALAVHPALNLRPRPGESMLHHSRIGSWLCFIETAFSRQIADWVPNRLPVPSQDTYAWYCATRLGREVRRVKYKSLGWQNWHTARTRQSKVQEIMQHDAKCA